MRQQVLIVAYYWPPAGGPGVQRWLKFVKYLPEYDIDPVVFVPENPSYPIIDHSLEQEIPIDIKVIKYPIKEPYGLASMLSRKQTKTISSGIIQKKGNQSWLQKAMLYVRGNFFVPDARVGWVKPSVHYLKNYIADNHIKTIITTGPPHSLHLIGRDLKKHLPKLRWFADFRDPWTTIGYHHKLMMTSKTKARHKRLEGEILNWADQIIVTSPSTRDEFALITSKPIAVITNGFDGDISKPSSSALQDNSFVLGHFGSLLSDRNPTILWESLSELIEENPAFRKALTVYLIGEVSEEIVNTIKKYKLNDYFVLMGYISKNQLSEYYAKVSSLLLIEIDSPITKAIIPGKIFEYLASKKPIIAIGPENGDASLIIKETASGTYFNYQQKTALKSHILELYTHRDQVTESRNDAIKKYHRKYLTRTLATLLKTN